VELKVHLPEAGFDWLSIYGIVVIGRLKCTLSTKVLLQIMCFWLFREGKMKILKLSAGILAVLLLAVCIFAYSRQVIDRFGIGNHIEYRNWKAGPVEFTNAHDGDQAPFTLPLNRASAGHNNELKVTLTKDIQVITFKQTDGTPIGTAKFDYANHRILATVSEGQSRATSLKIMSGILGKSVSPVNRLPYSPQKIAVLNEADKRSSYAKYKEAVIKASKNVPHPDGHLYYKIHEPESGKPAFFKKLIDHFVDDEDGSHDMYYGSYTYITGEAIFKPSKRIWIADKYDSGKFMKRVSIIEYRGDGVPGVKLTWEEYP